MRLIYTQTIIMGAAIAAGILFVFSGMPGQFYFTVYGFCESLLSNVHNGEQVLAGLSYTIILVAAISIVISPLSTFGGMWFLKMAFDLSFGMHRDVNVFVFSKHLNLLFAVLCIVMFIYCLNRQLFWIKRFTEPQTEKLKHDDVSRFI